MFHCIETAQDPVKNELIYSLQDLKIFKFCVIIQRLQLDKKKALHEDR